jgi:TatA/E family protein of Tat protein translocase
MGHIVPMDIDYAALAFIDGLGAPEMMLIFVVVLVLFGGQKLPEFARGLGKSIREFKKAAAGVEEEFKRALEEDERKTTLAQLPPPPPVSSVPESVPDHSAHDYDHSQDDYHHDEYGNPLSTTPTADAPVDPAGPGSPVMDPTAVATPPVGETSSSIPAAAVDTPSNKDPVPSNDPIAAAAPSPAKPTAEEAPEKKVPGPHNAPPVP